RFRSRRAHAWRAVSAWAFRTVKALARGLQPVRRAGIVARVKKSGRAKSDRRVVVGLVQMRCAVDPAVNLAAAVKHVRAAAKKGAGIVCLPELFRSRYFCQAEDHASFTLAEPIPGPSTTVLGKLARELGIVIVASLFERRAAGVYHNTVVVLDAKGAVAGMYRKMHIPDDPLFYEKFYFTPGDLGFRAFDV